LFLKATSAVIARMIVVLTPLSNLVNTKASWCWVHWQTRQGVPEDKRGLCSGCSKRAATTLTARDLPTMGMVTRQGFDTFCPLGRGSHAYCDRKKSATWGITCASTARETDGLPRAICVFQPAS